MKFEEKKKDIEPSISKQYDYFEYYYFLHILPIRHENLVPKPALGKTLNFDALHLRSLATGGVSAGKNQTV